MRDREICERRGWAKGPTSWPPTHGLWDAGPLPSSLRASFAHPSKEVLAVMAPWLQISESAP